MKEDFDFLFNEHQGVGSFDSSYKNGAHWGFGAGQQSKQAEVDELQKRIDGALIELEAIHLMKTGNSNNAIKILKGDRS